MKVKDLIAKLQLQDQELDVVLEPHLSSRDTENSGQIAYDAISNHLPDILINIIEAQSTQDSQNSQDNSFEVGFDSWINPTKSKKVLILTWNYFKYHSGE